MDDACTLFDERLRVSRAVCVAAAESDRIRRAAGGLWTWLDDRYSPLLGTQTRGGLKVMKTPPGARAEMEELHAAKAVCDTLSVDYCADAFREMDGDGCWDTHRLAEWRKAADATEAGPRQGQRA